jgi:hypothetical protein
MRMPKQLTLLQWVKQNRAVIDAAIRAVYQRPITLNDDKRREWILNHGPLYRLAKLCGVKI